MLFDSLDRLKRNTIMTAIILMFVGNAFLLVPGEYVQFLSASFAFVLVVASIVSVLSFIESQRAFISYIKLFCGLLIGTIGIMFFLVQDSFLTLVGSLVILVPALFGIYGIFHAIAFARRSGRRGWWMLIVFSCLLLLFALFGIFDPWDTEDAAIKVIGGTLLYSSLVLALSLIWIWPFNREEEE